MISGVRQEDYYKAIQYIHISEGYPIEKLCRKLNVNRSAYYKWRKRTPSGRQIENEQIVEWIKTLYEEQDGILGYRQMTITVNREYNVHYNKKRIRRLMQIYPHPVHASGKSQNSPPRRRQAGFQTAAESPPAA